MDLILPHRSRTDCCLGRNVIRRQASHTRSASGYCPWPLLFLIYISMTYRTVLIRQPSDCLLMIVWFTKKSTLSKTPKTSKQTSMRCRPGSVGGWWVFIPRSVNACESHGSHLRSSPSTTSTGMYWRWLIQQSTLEWLSKSTVHGLSTSTRQPRRPTTLVPSSKGISAEHQHRSRNEPTRLSLGQCWSTLALSGTHTGWRGSRHIQAGDGVTPVCQIHLQQLRPHQ